MWTNCAACISKVDEGDGETLYLWKFSNITQHWEDKRGKCETSIVFHSLKKNGSYSKGKLR